MLTYYLGWIGINNYRILWDEVGGEVELTTGLSTLLILLQCPMKELFMTGFTFYAHKIESWQDKYFKGIITPDLLASIKEQMGDRWADPKTHRYGHGELCHRKLIIYFYKLLKKQKYNITIDSYFKHLFCLKHYENVLDIGDFTDDHVTIMDILSSSTKSRKLWQRIKRFWRKPLWQKVRSLYRIVRRQMKKIKSFIYVYAGSRE